jgi:hypothetical protein
MLSGYAGGGAFGTKGGNLASAVNDGGVSTTVSPFLDLAFKDD